jgi:hypothetical protein
MVTIDGQWTIEPPIAKLRCGGLRGLVNFSRPQQGVFDLRFGDRAIDGQLLAVKWAAGAEDADNQSAAWPAAVADAYVRDGDLVATYGQMPDWPYAPQIYWRVESVSTLGATIPTLSLLVSIQTDSLDTHPAIRVATRLRAVEVMEVGPAAEHDAMARLWRLSEHDLSYLEVVPQSDFGDLAVGGDAAGHLTTEWRLFGEFLEKGVIRRARLLSAFLPRERDEELAAACCGSLQERPLPLTT